MKKGKGKREQGTGWGRLVLTLVAAVALATGAWAEDAKALVAYNTRVEQRFPWNDYVDVRFSISNTLESAKSTNIIARVRAYFEGQMLLDIDHLYLANADGSPDLSRQFIGGDVFLEVDERGYCQQDGLKPNEVRLVWDAGKDLPDVAKKVRNLRVTVQLEPPTQDVEVQCHNGRMIGEAHGIGEGSDVTAKIVSFLGVPFAHPPTNDFSSAGELTHARRWMAPEWAPTNLEAKIEAKRFAPAPFQSFGVGEYASATKFSEDCLYLNIWTGYTNDVNPVVAGTNKAVYVFIHGGGHGWGSSKEPLYDGRFLAERYGSDVVVVTVSYRLGMLSFFDFSDVEGWDEEAYPDHGRIQLLDLVTALKWLKANIRQFGGDPGRITISGESAGSVMTAMLTAWYNDDGNGGTLFRSAIPFSGPFSGLLSRGTYTNAHQGAILREALKKVKDKPVVTMTDLQKATEEELFAALGYPLDALPKEVTDRVVMPPMTSGTTFGQRVWDVNLLPLSEGRDTDAESCQYAAIPTNCFELLTKIPKNVNFFTGSTGHESRYWAYCSVVPGDNPLGGYYTGSLKLSVDSYRKIGPKIYEEYMARFHEKDDDDPAMNYGGRYPGIWTMAGFQTEMQVRIPQIRMAECYAANTNFVAGGACGHAYMYKFDKETTYEGLPWTRAMHACDLPYLFANPYWRDGGKPLGGIVDDYTESVMNFVITGVPTYRDKNGRRQNLAPYDPKNGSRMTLIIKNVTSGSLQDGTMEVVNDPLADKRKLLTPLSERVPPGVF